MDTEAARAGRHGRDALLWAGSVAWLGALLMGGVVLWLDIMGELFFAFVEVFTGPRPGDPSGWLLSVALTAMAMCLLSALGAAWVVATTPGSRAPSWLVGALSGVLGWAVGGTLLWLVLGA